MSQTLSSAIAAAVTFSVQKTVLKNLRAELVFADSAYAQKGSFDPGTDTLTFVDYPDLAQNTTPLTEGASPTPKALTMGTVNVSASQYGDVVDISDVAKIKSANDLSAIASERVGRQIQESLDTISRDVIAAGGTPAYANAVAARASLVQTTDNIDAADLRKLKAKMTKGKIKPMADGFYRMFISPEVELDLRGETGTGGFVDSKKYDDSGALDAGEIGRFEGFKFILVNNAPTFSSVALVHASIAVGSIAGWGTGELQSLRVYHQAPGGDHADILAQSELIGWKVMFGVAVLKNSFYFRFESTATVL
jgi:N4-gp56 family major capsid protein